MYYAEPTETPVARRMMYDMYLKCLLTISQTRACFGFFCEKDEKDKAGPPENSGPGTIVSSRVLHVWT